MWWLFTSAWAVEVGPGLAYAEIQEAIDAGESWIVLVDEEHAYQSFVVDRAPGDRAVTIEAAKGQTASVHGSSQQPAAHVISGDVTLIGIELRDSLVGGLLAAGPQAQVTLQDVEIRRNQAIAYGLGAGGGARASLGAHLRIEGGRFRNNGATFGGGLEVEHGSTAEIIGTVFESNTATSAGGGIDVFDASVTLIDVVFQDNEADLGGHVSIGGATLIDDHSSFLRGHATSGGALYAFESELFLSGSWLEDNVAYPSSGGAIVTALTEATLEQLTSRNNHAALHGGMLASDPRGELIVHGLVSEGDTAGGDGGVVFASQLDPSRANTKSSITIAGSQLSRSSAGGRGGAVALVGLPASLIGNHIVGTQAAGGGGAVVLDGVPSASLSGNLYCDTEALPGAAWGGGAVAVVGGCPPDRCSAGHERLYAPGAARGGAYYVAEAELSLVHVSVRAPAGESGALAWLDPGGALDITASWIEGAPTPAWAGATSPRFDQVNLDSPDPVDPTDGVSTDPTQLLASADPALLPCGVEFRLHPDSPLVGVVPSPNGSRDLGAYEVADALGSWDDDRDGDGVPLRYDCDDGDTSLGGGLPEVCDGADNDCDGTIDEPAPELPDDGIDQDCDGVDGVTYLKGASCGCRSPGPPGPLNPLLVWLAITTLIRRIPPGRGQSQRITGG